MATKKKPALTEVKDFTGNPVRVGDKVVFIEKGIWGGSAELAFGVVEGLSRVFGSDCVVIKDGIRTMKPTSQSIYKI
jgi:hypothetical protein